MSRPHHAPLEVDALTHELFRELDALRRRGPDHGQALYKLLDEALFRPAHEITSRSGKGVRARIMEHAWALAGGRPGEMPALLPVSIELLHAGSLVIDDIEDDSSTRRGRPTLHQLYGLPIALNTGNWLYFASMACLTRVPCDDTCRLSMTEDFITGLLRCHEGQALDVSVTVTTLPRAEVRKVVFTTTDLKTGTLMALATAMGARCAGASDDLVERMRAFGSRVGLGLQMLDDWSSIHREERRHKGLEDLRLGRPTWPWAWLSEHTDQVSFADFTRRAREASIEWEFDRLRERMATALAPIAPRLIGAQMEEALALLADEAVEPAAALGVEAELDALMCAFG